MRRIVGALLVFVLFCGSFPYSAQKAQALGIPQPTIKASDSSLDLEVGDRTWIDFDVTNNGAATSSFYVDVSFSSGLDVIDEDSDNTEDSWRRYDIGEYLYNARSQNNDFKAVNVLYSFEGDHGHDGSGAVSNYSLKFKAIAEGSQWIKYRASFLNEGSAMPDKYIRYPSMGPYYDQQGWYVKMIDVDVEESSDDPSPPTPPTSPAVNTPGISIGDYISVLTGKTIYGASAAVSPANQPVEQGPIPNANGNFEMGLVHGKNGTIRIKVTNTGSGSDKFRISSSYAGDVRFAQNTYRRIPALNYGGNNWDGDYVKTLDFTIGGGETKEIDAYVQVASNEAIGKMLRVPFTINSLYHSSVLSQNELTYVVISKDEFNGLLTDQQKAEAWDAIDTLIRFGIVDYKVLMDDEAPDWEKDLEIFGIALMVVPYAKAESKVVAVEIKAAGTGVKSVARQVSVKNLRKIGVNGLTKEAADAAMKSSLRDILGVSGRDGLLKKLNSTSKDAITELAINYGETAEFKEFIINANKLKDIEGFNVFMAKTAKNTQEFSNTLFASRRMLAVSDEVAARNLGEKATIAFEKEMTVNGAKADADIFVKVSEDSVELYNLEECKNVDLLIKQDGKVNVEKLKIDQMKVYVEGIRSGSLGMSVNNAKVVYFVNSVDTKITAEMIARDLADKGIKDVEIRLYGTGVKALVFTPVLNPNEVNIEPNHKPATYAQPVTVTFDDAALADMDVYFTLDGKEPTTASRKYDRLYPPVISKTTTVKYFVQDRFSSKRTATKTATYTINSSGQKALRITGDTGEALFGGIVILSNSERTYALTEGQGGVFNLPDIPLGKYKITVKKAGYKNLEQDFELFAGAKEYGVVLQKQAQSERKFKWGTVLPNQANSPLQNCTNNMGFFMC